QQGRWSEARAVLEQAAERLGGAGPDDLRQRLEQARAGLDLVDRLDSARLRAAAWVGDRFDWASAERDFADAFRRAGLGEEGAAGFFRAALALRPEAASIHNNLGHALQNAGRLDEALAEYDQALALDPGLARAHYNRANLLKGRGRQEEAVAGYRQALAFDPK